MPTNPLQRLAYLERVVRALDRRTFLVYSKGSFNPTLVGSGVAGTFTYGATDTNLFEWTRVGNMCFFRGRLVITATAVAPTLNMTINGWPFPGVCTTNMAIAGFGHGGWSAIVLPAGYTYVSLQFANGSSNATMVRSGQNVANAVVQGAELVAAAKDFRFEGHYQIAAT